MRIAVLTAALLVVAGCSSAPTSQPSLTPIAPKTTTGSAPSPSETVSKTPVTSAIPAAVPSGATPIESVMSWVEAGTAADASDFHTAIRDGVTTQLGDDVAFVTPSGTTKCMTDRQSRTGRWRAWWISTTRRRSRRMSTASGTAAGWTSTAPRWTSGRRTAIPGRFGAGDGAELPYGSSLRFGDYQCRADPAGLFCVNYAHQSAVKFADSGVEPLGCLRMVSPPPDIGLKFSC